MTENRKIASLTPVSYNWGGHQRESFDRAGGLHHGIRLAGNLSNDTFTGEGTRTFDAENRMKQAWANSQWQTYTYDGDGRRVKRIVNGTETWQVYGLGGELLAEYAANATAAGPQKEYGYRNGQLLITADSASGGGGSGAQSVTWTNTVGVTVNGNNLTKTAADGWGNSGAASTQSISSGDGYVETTVSETSTYRLIGLSHGDTDQSYTDIDFAIYPAVSGGLYIYEGGTGRGTFGTYATGDVLRVAVEGGVVKYRKNGTLLYTSTITPTYPLLVDTSLYSNGSTLNNVVISGAGGGGSSSARIHWLVTDQLGTPRMIFDQSGSLTVTDQNGTYLSGMTRHDYLPFGEELFAGTGGRTAAQGYTGDNVRQKFTDKERDSETGLDYFKARYYSSTQGRFTSADAPFADQRQTDPSSWNAYAYVRNNPCNRTDPNGRCSPPPGLKPGQVGICIEAFIATKTVVQGLLRGDNRTFSGIDDKLTSKFRVDIIAERTPGNSKNLNVTEKTKAGYTQVLDPINGLPNSPPLQGTANSKLNSTQGSSGAPAMSAYDPNGATSITVPIDKNGNASFNVSTKAENAFADFVDGGSIRSSINLSLNANTGQASWGEGSKVSGYPSFGIYSYVYDGKGNIVTTKIKEIPETKPEALKEPMRPIQ